MPGRLKLVHRKDRVRRKRQEHQAREQVANYIWQSNLKGIAYAHQLYSVVIANLVPPQIGKFSVSHGILIGCDYGYDVTSGTTALTTAIHFLWESARKFIAKHLFCLDSIMGHYSI